MLLQHEDLQCKGNALPNQNRPGSDYYLGKVLCYEDKSPNLIDVLSCPLPIELLT